MESDCLVFIVDDIPSIVDLACHCLQSAGGFACCGYNSTEQFLAEFVPDKVDCVVTDLKMPGLGGDELHRRIMLQDPLLSFVFMSGYADVATAVRLMEQGAVTLVEKPFTPDQLVAAVRRGSQRTRQLRAKGVKLREAAVRLSTMTQDECEVLECMVAGLSNKGISHKLALSSRTVDRRRQSILQKMKVDSLAELITLVLSIRDSQL